MIVITGGAHQGKTDFAKTLPGISDDNILNSFHKMLGEWITQGGKPAELTARILEDRDIKAVISDDVGMGIVPIDKAERYIREETGRQLCTLSKAADEVYRVVCGIGIKIKG